jgi:hypothetical protein
MLSDQGADLVMAEIEMLTDGLHWNEEAVANAMLNHLYDLHTLRDIELYNDLCYLAVKQEIAIYSEVWDALAEMNNA